MLLKHWLAAPTVAPTLSNTSPGIYLFRHRRVNPDGTYTAPSPHTIKGVLPNTLTPETYAFPSDVYRDEFLISNDDGATWRVIPRTGTLTGAQTVSSFSTSWATTTLADTQTSAYTAVDFGRFLVAYSRVETVWLLNSTATITSLRFNVLDDLSAPVDNLNNILEIAITGIVGGVSDGTRDTSFNTTKIYNRKVFGSNYFPVSSIAPSAIRLELQLVDYPLTGLSEDIDYQLSIVPNSPPTPVTSNPVRAGRIIDSIDSSGLSDFYLQDSDGLYVYLTTNSPITIGSPTSGANIAQIWTDKLFKLIWETYPSNPIFDSSGASTTRGTSAAADYAANKRLQLPHLGNRVLAGRSSTNALGSQTGAEKLTLTIANLPSHSHTLSTAGGHTHTPSTAGSHTHTTSSEGTHQHSVSITSGTQSENHHHNPLNGGTFLSEHPTSSGSFSLVYASGSANYSAPRTANESANHTHNVSGNTANAGAHTHTVASAGDHTHTLDTQGDHTHTVGSTGSGDEIDLRQPTHYVHKLISTGY